MIDVSSAPAIVVVQQKQKAQCRSSSSAVLGRRIRQVLLDLAGHACPPFVLSLPHRDACGTPEPLSRCSQVTLQLTKLQVFLLKKIHQKMNCLTRNKKREYLKNVIDMPLLANLSIAHTVEHSAVNRVVVGSSPTGGAKRCHYQQSVDDAGGSPRVLADFAH